MSDPETTAIPLRVLLIDENSERAQLVKEGLDQSATVHIATTYHGRELLQLITSWKPDVIIMDCYSPDRDTIESLRQIAQTNPKPIIMFVEEGGRSRMQEALNAGVSAYVVDGLTPKRVNPLIDTAIARFRMVDGLKSELRRTKDELAARKVIEKAKGILMERRQLSENEAFAAMRSMSQEQGKPLKEIAENVISVLTLLDGLPGGQSNDRNQT